MLRTKRVLFLFFMATIMSACAPKVMISSEALLNPTVDKAIVRFMRPTPIGALSGIIDGDIVIGHAIPKSQFDYLADPGRHVFISVTGTGHTDYMEADLEAGKTYYAIIKYAEAPFYPMGFLIAVNKDSAYWEKVKEFEVSLKKLQPVKEFWDQHNRKNQKVLKEILDKYETRLKDAKSWQKLSPEDGR